MTKTQLYLHTHFSKIVEGEVSSPNPLLIKVSTIKQLFYCLSVGNLVKSELYVYLSYFVYKYGQTLSAQVILARIYVNFESFFSSREQLLRSQASLVKIETLNQSQITNYL